MLTSKPESNPGIDEAIKTLKIIPISMNTKPRYNQFFAVRGSSWRKIKYAISPPLTPKNSGNKNHALLLGFSGYDIILHNYFAVTVFLCNCVISTSTVSNGSSTWLRLIENIFGFSKSSVQSGHAYTSTLCSFGAFGLDNLG